MLCVGHEAVAMMMHELALFEDAQKLTAEALAKPSSAIAERLLRAAEAPLTRAISRFHTSDKRSFLSFALTLTCLTAERIIRPIVKRVYPTEEQKADQPEELERYFVLAQAIFPKRELAPAMQCLVFTAFLQYRGRRGTEFAL